MVLRNIPPEASTVLDFGAVESMLPMTLAAPGRRVTVWDRRPYAFAHPLLSVVPQDLLSETPPGLGTFDIVISVPTIEHLGLDSYGDVVMDNADSRGSPCRGRWCGPAAASSPPCRWAAPRYIQASACAIAPDCSGCSLIPGRSLLPQTRGGWGVGASRGGRRRESRRRGSGRAVAGRRGRGPGARQALNRSAR
jgi:hypothetical protein